MPPGHAQDQVARNAFGGGQRQNAVGIGIVAERAGEGHIDAGAREIDRGVERIAAAADRKAPVVPRASSIMTSPTLTTRDAGSLMNFSVLARSGRLSTGKEAWQMHAGPESHGWAPGVGAGATLY